MNEAIVERENMLRAYKRVFGNNGSAGIDGTSPDDLGSYLQSHWLSIRSALLEGLYRPGAVQRAEIPKSGGGGMRKLGIPTVQDRLIQQAVHQVLAPLFEADFSEHSYGYRQGRCARQAVSQARAYVKAGKRWVVDIDIANFFNRVIHDMVMNRIARKVSDKRPWQRKFLGYTVTRERKTRLRVARELVQKLKASLKQQFRRGRGINLGQLIEDLQPRLRDWLNYFGQNEVAGVFEQLDGWIRRRIRLILWRQWKRPYRRAKALMQRGLCEERAWKSATNRRGLWWNSGASTHELCLSEIIFR